MSVSDADIAFALELFAPLGGLHSRKMMGGLMIYQDGQVFSLVTSDGTIFLKAKGGYADQLADEGAQKFEWQNKDGKVSTMGYWTLPEAALDDPDLACDWARKALENSI